MWVLTKAKPRCAALPVFIEPCVWSFILSCVCVCAAGFWSELPLNPPERNRPATCSGVLWMSGRMQTAPDSTWVRKGRCIIRKDGLTAF